MPDAPELPEAKDSYERFIALTIAILAVILAFVDNTGDNAKTDAIVKTTQAANKWAYFQSKSLKENIAESNTLLLGLLAPVDAATAKAKQEEMTAEVQRYDGEKNQLMAEAKGLEDQAARSMGIDDRADEAALLLQVAVVVCSIAILVRWKAIFVAGSVVGVLGIAAAVRAFLGLSNATPHAAHVRTLSQRPEGRRMVADPHSGSDAAAAVRSRCAGRAHLS